MSHIRSDIEQGARVKLLSGAIPGQYTNVSFRFPCGTSSEGLVTVRAKSWDDSKLASALWRNR